MTSILNRFHSRIFFQLILTHAFLILVFFGSLFGGIAFGVIRQDSWDHWFFFLFGMVLLLEIGFAALLARRLVFPIGRMLVQARTILDTRHSPEESQGDYHGESQLTSRQLPQPLSSQFPTPFGEDEDFSTEVDKDWSDLESSIVNIRKNLEAKIQSLIAEREEQAILMSAISDAILAVDQEGAPLFYNTRFALLIGNPGYPASSASVATPTSHQSSPKKPHRLWEIFRNPEILDAFQKALKSGESTNVPAVAFESPTGKRYYSISVSPLRKSGAVGIFHDVSELKQAEQIRIDFVANVSHELRTPLTAIKGYTDTLIQDMKEGRDVSVEFLEVIARNSERLMNLMNDLLDLSALESTEQIHRVSVSTREVTEKTLTSFQRVFEQKNRQIQLEFQTETVWADPRRVEQVLINLLDNANKYSPPGGAIQVRWVTGSVPPLLGSGSGSGSNSVLLKITDSGPGIPPEHQARLFERFYRVDKGRSREQGGTGLGLAIVKHIIQRHGGIVWVESLPGQGATFVCSFPEAAIG